LTLFKLAGCDSGEEARLLLATGRYVGKGFLMSRLDTLFLTLPSRGKGDSRSTLVGLHRLFHNKREVRVYDYADLNVPMLARMFDRRCHHTKVSLPTIQLPGSAVPGWPADVPLPVIPTEKPICRQRARLVRDDVDSLWRNYLSMLA